MKSVNQVVVKYVCPMCPTVVPTSAQFNRVVYSCLILSKMLMSIRRDRKTRPAQPVPSAANVIGIQTRRSRGPKMPLRQATAAHVLEEIKEAGHDGIMLGTLKKALKDLGRGETYQEGLAILEREGKVERVRDPNGRCGTSLEVRWRAV